MSDYTETVEWNRSGAIFVYNRYSRKHCWLFDGGIEVAASSSPDVVPVPLSSPDAIDPEEAFIASLSSCHMLCFLSIAAKHGYVVEHYTDPAVGTLSKNAQGKLAITVVILRPKVIFTGERQPDREEIDRMHHLAHGECFIASSVRSEIKCEPVYVT